MPLPEAPSLENFEPERAYQTLGVGYITMRNPDGVRLDLSEHGVAAVDRDPEIAGLLGRMGVFVAEHGFYKATIKIPNREPGSILKVSETRRESHNWERPRRFASVYHPDRAPGVVVKAHDYCRVNAGLQFYLGAWLHEQLEGAGIGITSPAQLGIMQAPGYRGHKSVIADYVPGKPLSHWAFTYGNRLDADFVRIVRQEAEEVTEATCAKLHEALGWRGRKIVNDPGGPNLIISDPDEATLDTVADQELSIIDQPSARLFDLPGLVMARHVPHLRRDKTRPLEAIESPATSS